MMCVCAHVLSTCLCVIVFVCLCERRVQVYKFRCPDLRNSSCFGFYFVCYHPLCLIILSSSDEFVLSNPVIELLRKVVVEFHRVDILIVRGRKHSEFNF